MSSLITEATIKVRRGDSANWTSENPVPLDGEICKETDTGYMKIGDGTTAWTSLLYFARPGLDVMLFNTSTVRFFPGWIIRKSSSDVVRCVVIWPDIPKQGTTITLTLPATALKFIDPSGNTATVTGAHSISSLFITDKYVGFSLTEAGAFAGLDGGPASFAEVNGTGCKLTIT